MIYYIADPHFGHKNILKLASRPFKSIEAMNEGMITVWNERVKDDDTVYILGDLFYRCADPEPILQRLKGKKHLIVGNHDDSWMGQVDLNRYFESVSTLLEICDGGREITLCHYPLLTWKNRKKSYMIHGHLHNMTEDDYFAPKAYWERVLNAGVEVNGYRPVTFEELQENNGLFRLVWFLEQWEQEEELPF